MSSSIDPDAVEIVRDRQGTEFGPSDTSDSASDVMGSDLEATDSDATGTGERSSVDSPAPSETEEDIAPDKVERAPQGDDAMEALNDQEQ